MPTSLGGLSSLSDTLFRADLDPNKVHQGG